jgi:uncharacterized protein YggE
MNVIRTMLRTARRGPLVAALLIAATAVFSTVAWAASQDGTPASATSNSTISVEGMGDIEVQPDAVSIVLGVTIIEDTLAEAQQTATSSMNDVLAALEAQGVPSEDIETLSYSVQVLQTTDENGLPVPGTNQFEVSNRVRVILRDTDAVGTMLDAVVQAGANTISGVNFIATDASEAAADARALAVEDARLKAEQLADAAGLRLGDVISINETFGPSVVTAPATGGGGTTAPVPIVSTAETVSAGVEITFELVG